MRRARARNAPRMLMPAFVGPVRVWGDGEGVSARVVAAALAVVAAGSVVAAALVVIVAVVFDVTAGDAVDDIIVEEDEGEEVGTEEEGKDEFVEAGAIEDEDDSTVDDTSVVNKVCTAVGSEASPSLLRAETPHVWGEIASLDVILNTGVLE